MPTATTTHVALLRGVNVGGHAKVAMSDLRAVFERLGHAGVRTYIQSGNVVFTCEPAEPEDLAGAMEDAILAGLGMKVTVMVRSAGDLARIVADNPFLRRGADPSTLYVAFLSRVPDADRVARLQVPDGDRDEMALAGRQLYLHCPDGYGRTKLSNPFIERRLAVAATTRNWRTVTKLLELGGG